MPNILSSAANSSDLDRDGQNDLVSREMLKTGDKARGFEHLRRDLENVNVLINNV